MISKLCYLLKELTILTKFQDDKAKIVDFSLIASFWASQKFYESPLKPKFYAILTEFMKKVAQNQSSEAAII